MRTHVGPYFVGPLVAQWVVIGQNAMGRSLMDRSIGARYADRFAMVHIMQGPVYFSLVGSFFVKELYKNTRVVFNISLF